MLDLESTWDGAVRVVEGRGSRFVFPTFVPSWHSTTYRKTPGSPLHWCPLIVAHGRRHRTRVLAPLAVPQHRHGEAFYRPNVDK